MISLQGLQSHLRALSPKQTFRERFLGSNSETVFGIGVDFRSGARASLRRLSSQTAGPVERVSFVFVSRPKRSALRPFRAARWPSRSRRCPDGRRFGGD